MSYLLCRVRPVVLIVELSKLIKSNLIAISPGRIHKKINDNLHKRKKSGYLLLMQTLLDNVMQWYSKQILHSRDGLRSSVC